MRTIAIFSFSFLLAAGIPSGSVAQERDIRTSFRWEDLSLRASLDSLMKRYAVSIVYFDRDVDGKSVSVTCTGCSFEQALSGALGGTSLMWIRMGEQYILRERSVPPPPQFATISGMVADSMSREGVADAIVLLQDGDDASSGKVWRWCPTNPFGFFSLRRVVKGRYTLVVRALGYQTATMPLHIEDDASVRHDVILEQDEITMQEVTVEGERSALTSHEGISKGLYIRSTPSDQNQYLLDGARIYNPAHFGNVLSTFNAEVLNDVQVLLGGIPPQYGGRIGGILDLSMREGTMERLSGTAGTGSLGSSLSLEGPLGNATSFLMSGRRGYPDPAVPSLEAFGTANHLGSSELIAKISHRLSQNSRIFLSGYAGQDSYTNHVEGNGSQLGNAFSWGNRALNLRWIGIASPSVFLHASAVFTRYDFALQHLLSGGAPLPPGTNLSSDYAVEDITVRAHAEHYYDDEHTMRGGVEATHHRMTGTISAFSTQTAPFLVGNSSSWEVSVYFQDQWRVLPRVTAELGARATTFAGAGGSFSAVDPRFSLLVAVDEQTRLYSSLSAVNQFIHPYRNSGIFLLYPAIFWYPSTERVRPSTSLQVTLGLEKAMADNALTLSAESYYRMTTNLHEFGVDTTGGITGDLNNAVTFGTGKVYGFGLSLRKRTGDLTGSIAYTLSWASQTFAELNGGNPFTPRFDRRHELQIGLSYAPGEHWLFGVLSVLASEQSASFSPRILQRSVIDGAMVRSADVIDLNGSRLPGFQRLELTMLYRLAVWGLPSQLSLRLLNGYGLLDPYLMELQQNSDIRFRWTAGLRELKLFPLFPVLGFAVRF